MAGMGEINGLPINPNQPKTRPNRRSKMASVTVVVRPARKENGKERPADLRDDKRGNVMVNGQDADTNQFITIYPFQKNAALFPADLIGKTAVFSGTLHPLGENVKMIAKTVDVVK
jgi:hypothetical protein